MDRNMSTKVNRKPTYNGGGGGEEKEKKKEGEAISKDRDNSKLKEDLTFS